MFLHWTKLTFVLHSDELVYVIDECLAYRWSPQALDELVHSPREHFPSLALKGLWGQNWFSQCVIFGLHKGKETNQPTMRNMSTTLRCCLYFFPSFFLVLDSNPSVSSAASSAASGKLSTYLSNLKHPTRLFIQANIASGLLKRLHSFKTGVRGALQNGLTIWVPCPWRSRPEQRWETAGTLSQCVWAESTRRIRNPASGTLKIRTVLSVASCPPNQ